MDTPATASDNDPSGDWAGDEVESIRDLEAIALKNKENKGWNCEN